MGFNAQRLRAETIDLRLDRADSAAPPLGGWRVHSRPEGFSGTLVAGVPIGHPFHAFHRVDHLSAIGVGFLRPSLESTRRLRRTP